ncbi:hypothetical protein [Nonomuraea candida]|uniref:hypothetical protein n=1 Tax=Nonomuraea candida TaxID=359159 RepID=UPI000AF7E424|nr:hypothetical protein [Nonomuraea candida]
MALTDAEMYDLLCRSETELLEIRKRALDLTDWTARQLAVLRRTYPEWAIACETDASGQAWWTARLLQEVSLEMATAGVDRTVRRSTAVSLAAALTLQTALVRSRRGLQRSPAPTDDAP